MRRPNITAKLQDLLFPLKVMAMKSHGHDWKMLRTESFKENDVNTQTKTNQNKNGMKKEGPVRELNPGPLAP